MYLKLNNEYPTTTECYQIDNITTDNKCSNHMSMNCPISCAAVCSCAEECAGFNMSGILEFLKSKLKKYPNFVPTLVN